ncbi:MAG: histidinol-phosphate transaminase [Bacteroidia bacterium]|nr:histidinol-phosphate transaminase [Bacteroidia bacterium]
MFSIDAITRKNIRELTPYSSARREFNGQAKVWLDANENPFETGWNRYPDPDQSELKKAIAEWKGVNDAQVFVGNGSDEIIDLLFRAFCEPQVDKAFVFTPTYGMYEVSAKVNNVNVVKLSLRDDFGIPSLRGVIEKFRCKGLLFICSPNNPTGTVHTLESIQEIAENFDGLVVVDEAYIDFSDSPSAINLLNETPNLVVLQTLSKAYGLAGLRLGMAFSSRPVIDVLNKIKPPYNVNTLSQRRSIEALKSNEVALQQIKEIKSQREWLRKALKDIPLVESVYPSEANFLLARFHDADSVFNALLKNGIVVRNRTSQIANCLRITIGTSEQNQLLINSLKSIKNEESTIY